MRRSRLRYIIFASHDLDVADKSLTYIEIVRKHISGGCLHIWVRLFFVLRSCPLTGSTRSISYFQGVDSSKIKATPQEIRPEESQCLQNAFLQLRIDQDLIFKG